MTAAETIEVNGQPTAAHYGDPLAEYSFLTTTAGVLDLSFRGRLLLHGSDRIRFLQGQVTNDVERLKNGDGCYAALVTAKGKMVSDLNILRFENQLLLDFEPGLSARVTARLNQFIIADDVQVEEAELQFGLLSVQGPRSDEVIRRAGLDLASSKLPLSFTMGKWNEVGEIDLVNNPRLGNSGLDLFVPLSGMESARTKLAAAARGIGGGPAGWLAFEQARIEAGIPRFGADMDESNLPPEAGLETRAISYSKGCYIGQEVIARIRTYGQVAKALRMLRLDDQLQQLPAKGEKLFSEGKEAGYITSAIRSPRLGQNLALGFVKREVWEIGNSLTLPMAGVNHSAIITALPFHEKL